MTACEKIIDLRNKGNLATSRGELVEADGFYTESVAAWGGDVNDAGSVEVVKSYGNRAALRLMQGLHEEGLGDALKAVGIQPCYARGMMLVGQLQWEICVKKNKPLDAWVWPFVTACSVDERYLTEVLKSGILQKVAAARAKQASLIENTSSKKSESSCYEVVGEEEGATVGRSVVATRDISPGEVIIEGRDPICIASDKPLEVCKKCGKEVNNGLFACKKCKATVYCGKKCKSSDEKMHSAECQAVSAVMKLSKQFDEMKNSFGITHTQLHSLGYLPAPVDGGAGQEVVDVEDLITTTMLVTCTAMRVRAGDVNNVMELESRSECVDLQGSCVRAMVNHAAWWIAADIVKGDFDVKEFTKTVTCIIQTNSFECGEGIALVGRPLAYVNHSCNPTAAKDDFGTLRASSHISQGQEITTAYIADLMQPCTHRRAALSSLQTFTCQCTRCTTTTDFRPPAADIIKCSCGGWVGIPEDASGRCISCSKITTYEEAFTSTIKPLEAEVERVAPVLLGSIDSLGEVDTELLDKLLNLRDQAHEKLHPFHWLSHRIHASLISPLLRMGHAEDAAAHSLYALAAADATLPAHWLGKSDRAEYVAVHYPSGDANIPKYMKTLYTKTVLGEMAGSLRGMGL